MNKNIPEELLPLLDWWDQNGKQTVAIVLVAAVAVAGYYGYKNWQENRQAGASKVLMEAYTSGELEDGVAKYDSTKAGPAIRLRLAKKYFDEERYQEALDLYTALNGKAPAGFEDIPAVGAAQCLEALGKYDEAKKAYDDFAAAKATSPLALSAKLGAARVVAAKGDKTAAVKILEDLKATVKDDAVATARIDVTIDVVKRWEKRAALSLFDAADAASKQLEAEKPAAEKPAAAKPAEKSAEKPAAKPAEKPAEKPAAPAQK